MTMNALLHSHSVEMIFFVWVKSLGIDCLRRLFKKMVAIVLQ